MNCLARRFRCSAFGVLLAVCWLSQSAKAQPLPDRQSLIGLVVDQNGAPVPETLVSVRRQSDMGAFAFWGGSVRTDKAGRFEFDDAEVGAYFINAEANGFAPALNQSLDLKPGSAPTRLQISRLTSLQLRLMAPPGAPLAQSRVFVLLGGNGDSSGRSFYLQSTDQGLVTLNELISGSYALFVQTPVGSLVQNDLRVSVALANRPFDLNLQTGGSLRLLLHDERGAAIGGATIVLRKAGQGPTDPQQSNNFEGQDWALLASQQDNLAVVTADGSGEAFFTHLPPGRYNATYSLPYYTSGQKTDIEVNTGETTEIDCQAVVSSGARLTLNLTNLDGTPYQKGEVELRPLEESIEPRWQVTNFVGSGFQNRRGTPDAQGHLEIYPLRPGTYSIFASPRRLPGDNNASAPGLPLKVTIPLAGTSGKIVVPPSVAVN